MIPESWRASGEPIDLDLSPYQPGACPPIGEREGKTWGDDDYEPCCSRHDTKSGGPHYDREGELFVDDGKHVVFLYWSEFPKGGVHTGWGGTDVWACRCGWQPNYLDTPYPAQPPFGEAGSPERIARIEWDREHLNWWEPYGFDFYRMHAYETRAVVIPPGYDWVGKKEGRKIPG